MKYSPEELIVYYKDKPVCVLSSSLVEKQDLTKEAIEELKLTHIQKAEVFEAMENTDNPKELRRLAKRVETIEFAQQKLWGFEQSSDYHYWWKVPKCTCPDLDNRDSYGTKYRHMNGNCPVHGTLPYDEKPV
jgi:hypothetical protein